MHFFEGWNTKQQIGFSRESPESDCVDAGAESGAFTGETAMLKYRSMSWKHLSVKEGVFLSSKFGR